MNRLIPVIFIFIMFSTTPVFAHKLIAVNPDNTMFQTATFIPDPFNNSYFTLEKFDREGQSHWYSFVGSKGQTVFIQTLVPNIASSRDLSVCFDLIIGNDKVTPKFERNSFHEEITNTDWIITCELEMVLPDDGLYYVRAHDVLHHYEFGDTGKFSFAIGNVDDFTVFDWLQVPLWNFYIQLFFENNMFVWIMLVLVIVLIGIIMMLVSRKKHR